MVTKQARIAVMGLKPSAMSMDAGMATAVPKPAIPSKKPPKHHPMSSTSTRLSLDTDVSMPLIVSMAPVWTVRL